MVNKKEFSPFVQIPRPGKLHAKTLRNLSVSANFAPLREINKNKPDNPVLSHVNQP